MIKIHRRNLYNYTKQNQFFNYNFCFLWWFSVMPLFEKHHCNITIFCPFLDSPTPKIFKQKFQIDPGFHRGQSLLSLIKSKIFAEDASVPFATKSPLHCARSCVQMLGHRCVTISYNVDSSECQMYGHRPNETISSFVQTDANLIVVHTIGST